MELRKKIQILETPGIEIRIQKETGENWKLVGTEAGRWEKTGIKAGKVIFGKPANERNLGSK